MEDRITFKITRVIPETSEAKSYILEPLNQVIHFLPGQFLTFIFGFSRKEIRRSYSIVSLPGEPIQVTVKKVENGAISRYILIEWKVGDLVQALRPAGRFTLQPQKSLRRDIFFLAAGSGIAPILPLIRSSLQEEPQSAIHLLYSNTSEDQVLFHKELEALSTIYRQFDILHFLSNPKSGLQKRQRLNNGILENLIGRKLQFDPRAAVFMICGPFTYMRMVKMTLTFMKFGKNQIKSENFIPELSRSKAVPVPAVPERSIKIAWKGQTYRVNVKQGQTVLRAGLELGLALPYSCEGGICSACACKCVSGKVKMTINEVLTDKELEDGWILSCTSYPMDDAVLISYPV